MFESHTDYLNHTWTYGFDAARNAVTLTDPLNHVTSCQVTSVTDANDVTELALRMLCALIVNFR